MEGLGTSIDMMQISLALSYITFRLLKLQTGHLVSIFPFLALPMVLHESGHNMDYRQVACLKKSEDLYNPKVAYYKYCKHTSTCYLV